MGKTVDYSAVFRLDGKVAIVTGAGGNLGAEMCAALSAVGASIIATDVNEQAVKGVADRLSAEGGAVTAMAHDVTVEGEWEAAVELAMSTYGGLDVVVNAAAIVPMNMLAELNVEEFRRVQDVNVAGTLLGCKQRRGRCAQMASVAEVARSSTSLLGDGIVGLDCARLLQRIKRRSAATQQVSRSRVRHAQNQCAL